MKRDVLYTRVSKGIQLGENQAVELRAWCKQQDIKPIEIHDVISGTKFDRKGLNRIMAMVRKKEVARLIVWKLDRFGRNLRETLRLVDELHENEAALICTSQGIDTRQSNPIGRFQLQILGVIAEYERNLIGERTKLALNRLKENGVSLGRPVEIKPAVRERIKGMRKAGMGYKEIAKQLRVGVASVYRIINKDSK